MSKLNLSLVTTALAITILVLALVQLQSHIRLERGTELLQQKSRQMERLVSDNQRLSNSLAQLRVAQAAENNALQELIRVRAELNKVREENEQSVTAAQNNLEEQRREVARLQGQIQQLREENQQLADVRDQLQELQAAGITAALPPDEPRLEEPPVAPEQNDPLAIRMIRTQGDIFAEKLKLSVAAKDDESFQEVFGRFLEVNGVQTNSIAAAVYDERTGRVIVRAPEATLDQIEQLTQSLDQSP